MEHVYINSAEKVYQILRNQLVFFKVKNGVQEEQIVKKFLLLLCCFNVNERTSTTILSFDHAILRMDSFNISFIQKIMKLSM